MWKREGREGREKGEERGKGGEKELNSCQIKYVYKAMKTLVC